MQCVVRVCFNVSTMVHSSDSVSVCVCVCVCVRVVWFLLWNKGNLPPDCYHLVLPPYHNPHRPEIRGSIGRRVLEGAHDRVVVLLEATLHLQEVSQGHVPNHRAE